MTSAEVAIRLQTFFETPPRPGVVSVYLFGSHAEDRAHKESDVDVGVLLRWDAYPTARERFDERVKLAADLPGAFGGLAADVVVLNDAPPEIGRAIVTKGRRLFCADGEIDHAYVRDIQLKAADIAPFLRRMRRIKLEAMAKR